MRFCNAGRTLTISNKQGLKLYDIAAEKCLQTLPDVKQAKAFCFSKDEATLVAAGSNRVVQLWDMKSGKLLAPPDGPAGRTTEMAFAPDGGSLYSLCNDGTLRQWDTTTAHERRRVPQERMQALTITPDGQRVLAHGSEARHWRHGMPQP